MSTGTMLPVHVSSSTSSGCMPTLFRRRCSWSSPWNYWNSASLRSHQDPSRSWGATLIPNAYYGRIVNPDKYIQASEQRPSMCSLRRTSRNHSNNTTKFWLWEICILSSVWCCTSQAASGWEAPVSNVQRVQGDYRESRGARFVRCKRN